MVSNKRIICIALILSGYYLFYFGLLNIKRPNISFNYEKPSMPKNKVIIVMIDALRLDMANTLRNKIPHKSLFFPMVVHSPTTTATKLKSLLSGYIPNIIEVKDSFSQQRIEIQHIFSEFGTPINSSVVFVGDDTWDQLLDFSSSYPMDSFNVWDLDSVDNKVFQVFDQVLNKSTPSVLIGHLLGVDHCGHTYYPYHPEMIRKFDEYSVFITNIINKMDNNTVLLVMGDHGQDLKGDHGGDSLLETMTALLVYRHGTDKNNVLSNIPVASSSINNTIYRKLQEIPSFQNIEMTRIIYQVDLVATIALFLNTFVPFSNLGTIIYELFNDLDFAILLKPHVTYANQELNMNIIFPEFVNISIYDEISRHVLSTANEQLNTFKPIYMVIGIVMILVSYFVTLSSNKFDRNDLFYIPYIFIYASNSYILSEQEISLFFVQLSLVHAFKKQFFDFYASKNYKNILIPVLCMVLMRLINNIVICREEFGPQCISTFYSGETTNTPVTLKWISMIFIPAYFYTWNSLLLGILHWCYAMGEEGMFNISEKVFLANLILLIALYKSRSRNLKLFIHSLCLLSCKTSGFIGIAAGYFVQTFVQSRYFFCFFSYNLFFVLGHQATLSHIMWDKGFVLSSNTNWTAPLFVVLNYFSSFLLFPKAIHLKTLFLASSCICAFILRKHLMAWKIFFPRWLLSMGDVFYIIITSLINQK